MNMPNMYATGFEDMNNWCSPEAQTYLDAQRIPFGNLNNRMPVAEHEPPLPLVVSTRCDHRTSRCIVCAPVLNGLSGAEKQRVLAIVMTVLAAPCEMTDEDLGLPFDQWTVGALEALYGPLEFWYDEPFADALSPDSPFAFWLGADHG